VTLHDVVAVEAIRSPPLTVRFIESQRGSDRALALESDGVGSDEIALRSFQFVRRDASFHHGLQFLSHGTHGFVDFLGAVAT